MDIWKYYAITHKRHVICNPMDKDKIYKLLELLNLEQRATVLDIGCGKGEVLIRLAELSNVSGIGVDISPYFLKDSRQKKEERVPNSDIRFMEMDGANYKNEKNEPFDLTMCIGASFTYGGFLNTINTLKKMTKPGGLLILGEPYWLKEPDREYLKMSGIKKENYTTHPGNIDTARKQGLNCLYTMVSSHDDWDHYETLQWWSTDDYITANPGDQDNAELEQKINKEKLEYLLYGRDTIGWAIYVFKLYHS